MDEEDINIEESDNQRKNTKSWLWKKGQSGNLKGRPPGKTMKEWAREYLSRMTDEEKDEFMDGIPKESVWKMAEGNPSNELTGKDGKDLIPDASPVIDELTKRLNAIHQGTSIGGNGEPSGAVDTETPDKE